jgi:hypothetical protein
MVNREKLPERNLTKTYKLLKYTQFVVLFFLCRQHTFIMLFNSTFRNADRTIGKMPGAGRSLAVF